MTNPLHLQGAT